MRNWVARTAVSELWKVRHCQSLHGVLCRKCRQRLPVRPSVKLCGWTAPGHGFCVCYSSDSGCCFFFPVKVETDKGCLYPQCPLQEVRGLGASAGRGLKGRKLCFLTCLCQASCCSVYTLGVCGRRGRTSPSLRPLLREDAKVPEASHVLFLTTLGQELQK